MTFPPQLSFIVCSNKPDKCQSQLRITNVTKKLQMAFIFMVEQTAVTTGIYSPIRFFIISSHTFITSNPILFLVASTNPQQFSPFLQKKWPKLIIDEPTAIALMAIWLGNKYFKNECTVFSRAM